ncbi:hypothetical protein PUN28_015265 [Cardiocondyla obscurior]|uniref:Uncharacterized protein n=1 Tax=Cardiocondyla obscurior TaxID=286306 RepID=A0AAW2EY63_9HYME
MANREKLHELFGSLSEGSESPPASPPPGAWPPPVDPSRRYPVPRVGTSVQRGDGSQRGHTRWLEEPPPALPKAPRKGQGRPRALPDSAAGATKTTIARSRKGPGQTTATGPQGSAGKAQPAGTSATSTSGNRRTDGGPIKTTAPEAHQGKTKDPGTSRPQAQPPGPSAARKDPAKPPVRHRQNSPPRQGPTIRAMEILQPARREPRNIAGIEVSIPDRDQSGLTTMPRGPLAHGRTTRLKAPRIRPATAAAATEPATTRARGGTVSLAAAARMSTTPNTPTVLPLPPFALELRQTTTPPVAPPPMPPVAPPTTTPAATPPTPLAAPSPTLIAVTSPAPPAYVREKGWTSRPGIPLAVPVQLPNGEITSVPMSAIRHNRKWRARTATGRWLLRFAPDGRLTMCRKIQGEASE